MDTPQIRTSGIVAWHVGDVLSLVTGHDVSPRGPAAADALREHILGTVANMPDSMETDANKLVSLWLSSHFPAMDWFNDEDLPPRELLPQWLARRAAEFGEYLIVPPIPLDVVVHYMSVKKRVPDPTPGSGSASP